MPPRKWSTKAPIELKRKPGSPLVAPNPNRNFFDGSRPGQPILRPADLLALRIELRNLAVTPGQPPRLKKAGDGVATLIVHFPPQSFTEQTFFERPAGNLTNPAPPRNDTPGVPQKEVGLIYVSPAAPETPA